jgi:hypothetical protein
MTVNAYGFVEIWDQKGLPFLSPMHFIHPVSPVSPADFPSCILGPFQIVFFFACVITSGAPGPGKKRLQQDSVAVMAGLSTRINISVDTLAMVLSIRFCANLP